MHQGGMHNSVRGRELSTTNSKTTRENNKQNNMNNKKEMAVGQSQSKLSRKLNEWSCHAVIKNDDPMEQQTTAAANINKDKLGPPLLDNGEGKQLFIVIKHKSTISKNNGKNKQTKEQSATMMASVNEQNNKGMAEADK